MMPKYIVQNSSIKDEDLNSNIRHKCEQCEYWSFEQFRLSRHVKVVHQQVKKCSWCDFHSDSKLELKNHQIIEHKNKMLFCTHCCYSIPRARGKSDLKMHVKKVHEKIFDEFCSLCDSSFSSMKDLRAHQKIAHKENATSQELPLFRRISDNYKIKCTECPYSTTESSSLRNHLLKIHHFAVCLNCSYQGNNFEELRNHCLKFHQNIYNIDPSRCHLCKFSAGSPQFSESFLSKTMIHIMAVHGGEHPCPTCNKNFKQKKHLKEHIKKYHLKNFDIHCEECNQAFWRKHDLVEHIRKRHREKPNIICTECNKKLSSEGFLKLHMQRHEKSRINGDAVHPCSLCNKKFKRKYKLKVHVNKLHLKQFDIHCQHCEKGFWNQSDLNAHLRKYHLKNTKPFSCLVCNITFSEESCLKCHMKKKKHVRKSEKMLAAPFSLMKFNIKNESIPESTQNRQKDGYGPDLRCPVMSCPLLFSGMNEVNLHLGNEHDLL